MSVAENIAMSKYMYEDKKLIDWDEVHDIARKQLEKIGINLDLDVPVDELSIGNRQIIAISRALALDAKLIFMDEPTTSLTKQEVDKLLEIVKELKTKGIAVVFISHKLDEVLEVADTVTILRDGKKVGDFSASELDEDAISRHMTGKDIEYPNYIKSLETDKPLLEVKNLTKKGHYQDISFTVKKGDIFGLAGLLGSGRTELALTLFGLNPPDSGEIYFKGKKVNIDSPLKAKDLGIGYLPKDRYTQGLFLEKDVKENISSAILDEITHFYNKIDVKRERKLAEENVEKLNIRTPSIETLTQKLSGGNQQKTVIGKWLATDPELFILNSPTVGIDVGAKAEIYNRIQEFADRGMVLIYISDEIDQIVNNCNRVLVIAEGEGVSMIEDEEMKSPNIETQIEELVHLEYSK